MNTEKQTDKRAIAWLSVAHVVNDTYSGFLNPIMPFIATNIGISMAIATVVISISHIFSSLFQPVFGFFADNFIKRLFIFWGLIFASIFIPLAPTANNVFVLTLFIILGSLGGSFFHPQASGFIIRFSKKDFAQNMGIFISAGTIGFSFGPIISALVTEHFGLKMVPYTAIVGLVVALLMFKYVPKISAIDTKPEQKEFLKSFKIVLSNKKIIILTLISIMKALITNSCVILLPFLWKDMGYSPSYIGISLFLFILMGGVASLISGKIEQLIGARKVFYISMIGTLPLMAFFVFTYRAHPTISIAVFVLMGFVTMLAMPVTMVMAQRLLSDYKSIIAGIINGFSWGIVAIFLSVIGFSAQAFGIAKVLLIISFFPAIFSVMIKYLPKSVEEI